MRRWNVMVGIFAAVVTTVAVSSRAQDRIIERFSPIPDEYFKISFAAGSAELTDGAKTILDRQAEILLEFPNDKPMVFGHADPYEAGSRQGAWDLGLARAIAASNYLIGKGVSANRLRPDSRGSEFVALIREPDEKILAGMRIVTTEIPMQRRSVGHY